MSRGSGLDVGACGVRLAEIQARKGNFSLTRYHSVPVDAGEDAWDVVAEAFSTLRQRPAPVRVGVGGGDAMLRYLAVPQVEDWRLERLMEFEVREIEERAGATLASSFNVLPVPKELDEDDTVLLGMVKEDLLEGAMDACGKLPVQGFSPSAIALYNAWLALGDHLPSTTLLVAVGATSLDLVLVRGAELWFARSARTELGNRDATLARNLGTDPGRARNLIERHLDLRLLIGERGVSETERVTRPLAGLYEPLPTLMSGMAALCRAQARLQDVTIDRILLTGGGSSARGLAEFVHGRTGLPCEIWDPSQEIGAEDLPADQLEALETDGPASVIALGLALSAADSDLYALEILPVAARRKRDFQQKGVFQYLAGGLAIAWLVANFISASAKADDLEAVARKFSRQASVAKEQDRLADELENQMAASSSLLEDLRNRRSVAGALRAILDGLGSWLPENLWVDGLEVELGQGKDWGLEGRTVPVVLIRGAGEDRSRRAADAFTQFGDRLIAVLPGGESAVQLSGSKRGRLFEWTLKAVPLDPWPGTELENEDDDS